MPVKPTSLDLAEVVALGDQWTVSAEGGFVVEVLFSYGTRNFDRQGAETG